MILRTYQCTDIPFHHKIYSMKKLLILLPSAFSLTTFAQEKQVAILEPIAITKEVSSMHRSMVRGEMVKAIGRQSGYAAFTRTDIDQIMSEQNFQQSGMVDDATRKRIGAMQGVDYVCVTKITKEGNNYYLEANLVNIETGKISNPATQYGELTGGSLSNMLAACEKLAAELVGRKVQYTSSYSRPSYSYSSSPKLSSDEEFSSTTGSSPKASSSSSTPQSYASAQVSSCDSRVDVSIVSCRRSGSKVEFKFKITNTGLGDVPEFRIYQNNSSYTIIFDNLGNQYVRQGLTIGTSTVSGGFESQVYCPLLEDVPCKGSVVVSNVPNNATSLTIKLLVAAWDGRYWIFKDEYINFRNIPIY